MSTCGRYSSLVCAYVFVQVPLLKATDERVHIWCCDRQGGTQLHGLILINNLPHFFVLLAPQRLDMEEWRFAPNLSFDMNNHSPAQFEVTLHGPAVGLEARIHQSAAIVEFTYDQVLRAHWGQVRRETAGYQCDLADYLPKRQVVKLNWAEVSHTPEPNALEELGETLDEGVKGHILALLASKIPMMMDTRLIRTRLGTIPQPLFPSPRASRRVVIPVFQSGVPCGISPLMNFSLFGCRLFPRMLDSSVWG